MKNETLLIIIALFNSLKKRDIKYCNWKSCDHMNKGARGLTDLDILAPYKDKRKCENILIKLSFKQVYSQEIREEKAIEDWIGYDENTEKLVHIHLHYKLIVGREFVKEYTLPWNELLLNTSIQDEDCLIRICNLKH